MKSAGKFTIALLATTALMLAIGVGSAAATLGIESFSASYQEPFDLTPPGIFEAGTKPPTEQAGIHADSVTRIAFDTVDLGKGPVPDESLKDVQVDLPAGFYGNPEAMDFCTTSYLTDHDGFCQPEAEVGIMAIAYEPGNFELEFPVYNMAATTEDTAVLGSEVFGSLVRINISARTDADYGLQANIYNLNQAFPLYKTNLVLWGVPADETNDPLRREQATGIFGGGAHAEIPVRPFLTAPARCDTPLTTDLYVDSWEHPGRRNPDGTPDLSDPRWIHASDTLPPLKGCDALKFEPSLKARPTTNAADSPTGLEFDLKVPQNLDPEGLSTAELRTAEVTLPEGLVINPSGANGLGSCSPQQIGLNTTVGAGSPRFDKLPNQCPPASRIGSVEVDTPVFAEPLKGSIFVARPTQNPFGNLLTIYVVVEGRGLVIKLAGKVTPDPVTGRLTTVFDEAPQLVFEHFKLNFFGGAFGVLRTPPTCGHYATTSTMTPWSAPQSGPAPHPADEYDLTQGPNGGGCAASLPVAPSFDAGSVAPLAGQYEPFVVNLHREDGTQEFGSVTLSPPPGLVAKLAGTPMCPDASLAAAAAKSGSAELASPSCPAASRVGSVAVAAGAGPAPYNTTGSVYLAGPYKGAPLSLAIVTPAVAGPYDLGTVVVRTALFLDPATAQVTAKTDPIPRILQGIPLDIRSISMRLDKPSFALNPTSCDPSQVSGSLLSTLAIPAPLQSRFQLAECGRLPFKPGLKLSLTGGLKRRAFPGLTAVLTPRPGDANIRSIQVSLPHNEFLEQGHIGTVCTRVQFAAEQCPAKSIYGTVSVTSPLVDYPLTGNVYLRSSDHKLPDLVPDLHGPISQPIHFESAGRIDSIKGGIRNTFELVPDVPFTKLTLTLPAGKKSLLVNSKDVCGANLKADVSFTAHNGLTYASKPMLRAKCGGKKVVKKHGKKGKGKHKKGSRGHKS